MLVGAAMVLTLLAGSVWMVLDRRAADIAAAGRETTSLAIAIAEQTSRAFAAANYVLQDLVNNIRARGIDSDEALVAQMGTPEVQRLLRDQASGSQMADAAIIGANGRLVNTSADRALPAAALDDRDYFQALRDDPTLGNFISDPVTSRVSGRTTIFMAHRISAPDGRFLGVLLGAIRLASITGFYRAVSNGDGNIIALRRPDGALLAQYPRGVLGTNALAADMVMLQGALSSVRPVRSMAGQGTDGVAAMHVAQALKDFALIVVVSRTEEQILANWRRQTRFTMAGVVLAAGALAMAFALLARQIARREASEAALTTALTHMSQGIMLIAADNRVLLCNGRAIEMLAVPKAFIETRPRFTELLRYQWDQGQFGPDGAALDPETRTFILAGGLSRGGHSYERRCLDGTVLEITSIPLADGGVVRTYTDVTAMRDREIVLQSALRERDLAEVALRQHRDDLEREVAERTRALAVSEARHRDVAEVASDWFWETDADHRITFLSPRFAEASGIPRARVLNRVVDDLVLLGFNRDELQALRATFDAGGVLQDAIHRVVLPGRGVRFWRMSGKPFRDSATGDFAGYRGTGTDVTLSIERNAALTVALQRASEAEQAAQQLRARLADAIEAIPEGIVLFDAEDRLVLCNARYGEIHRLPDAAMQPGIHLVDILRASFQLPDMHNTKAWLTTQLARHSTGEGLSGEQRLPSGRWLQVAERRTSDGGTVGICIDVTEARQHQATEREREKLAALGHLAGGVAHEINNLMQPILVLPEMLRDSLQEDDLEAREDLDCIIESARKVRDIVRNILLFARKEEPRLTPLDLVLELRAALRFVRDLMPPSVTVREEGLDAHQSLKVAANRTQLTQVVTNLLVNAAQATHGSGTVTVTMGDVTPVPALAAELGIESGRNYLAVSVADTGCGMDQATQARIFEPFFTTKPVGQGTGLGLSVAYGILQSWRGAIAVHSTPGEGTTFTLYLPVMDAAA